MEDPWRRQLVRRDAQRPHLGPVPPPSCGSLDLVATCRDRRAFIGTAKPMHPQCGGWRQPTSLRSAAILRPTLATSAIGAEAKDRCGSRADGLSRSHRKQVDEVLTSTIHHLVVCRREAISAWSSLTTPQVVALHKPRKR